MGEARLQFGVRSCGKCCDWCIISAEHLAKVKGSYGVPRRREALEGEEKLGKVVINRSVRCQG